MINNYDWAIKHTYPNQDLKLVDRIIDARGIDRSDLTKTMEDMYDPFLMKGMSEAVARIIQAKNNNEKIIVYGDYDADGTGATKILRGFLLDIGCDCDYYIPDRLHDGYGITDTGLTHLLMECPSLVITVDCGITAIEEVETLNCFDIDVIITDHHEPKSSLPNALAVLDCKRKDNTYPFDELCGAGVAYKLCTALAKELSCPEYLEDYIMFAAISTIADMVPLVDENRIIVKAGLDKIRTTTNPSIISLLTITDKLSIQGELKSDDIAFYVAPRINASSRMGRTDIIMDIFFSNDIERCNELAAELSDLNELRVETNNAIYKEATLQIVSKNSLKSVEPIVVVGDGWHHGVIGIVASDIAGTYIRPSVVLSRESNGNYKGSCRNAGDTNIMDLLNYASDHILRYGGHKGAAGLTIEASQLDSFISKINEFAYNNYDTDMFRPVMEAEMEINAGDITVEDIESLELLEPHGFANPSPVFVCRQFKAGECKKIGKKPGSENAHLSMSLSPSRNAVFSDSLPKVVKGIAFFKSEYVDVLPLNKDVNLLFSLNVNKYTNPRTNKTSITPQLMIEDIHFQSVPSHGSSAEESELYTDEVVELDDIILEYGVLKADLVPTQADYQAVFKVVHGMMSISQKNLIISDLNNLAMAVSTQVEYNITPFKLDRILEAVSESGFISYKKLLFDKIALFAPAPGVETKPINLTNSYIRVNN